MTWMNFNKSFAEFTKLKRNLPGVLIEAIIDNKKKVYLIGDITPTANSKTGKPLFNNETIISRYKYIWGHWEACKPSCE